ncbi:MAG TPA: M23 family metallopeptidase [Anaerolineales bacterium]|nr:M23 family metallopeptidase [Anaerolineales bacterium]
MKLTALFFLIFFLTSCGTTTNVPDIATNTIVVPSPLPPTFTATPTELLPTVTPQPTATQIPCDPSSADFCITDGHFIFQRPIKLLTNTSIDPTYPYGSTARGTRDPHHGVEFQSPFGTPVYAAGDGVVLFAGADERAIYSPWPNFYGNLVVIEHENDLFTLYAHLSRIDVQSGTVIQEGDKLGEVGQSGAATGSHLHFEVRRGVVEDYFSSVNPELWLAPTKNENGAIAISVVDQSAKFQIAELTISYYPDRSQPPVLSYYATTYARDLSTGEENAAVSDVSPGNYRIAFTMNGRVYERWVEVKSGRLTQVVFVAN